MSLMYITPDGEPTNKPDTCLGCPCYRMGTDFSQVEIGARYEKTRLLLIGEASGEGEAREGLPFRPWAQSGSLLADALRETCVARADIAITNVLRCRPKNDYLEGAPYQFSAITKCISNYLYDVIRQLQPRAILALGGTAMRALTSTAKGRYGTVEFLRGYVLEGKGPAEGIPVVPGWHPSHVRRGMPHLTPHLYKDLRRASLIALGRAQQGVHWAYDLHDMGVRYQTQPSLEEAWEWAKAVDPQIPIVWDCETRDSTKTEEEDRTSFNQQDLVLVQFTQRRGEGIAIPYRDEYKEVVAYILGLPNDKVTHNGWAFDDEVAEQSGITIVGQRLDAMCMFGFYYSDLPKNLQSAAQMCGFPAPWKHLGDSDLEFYGCADTDATLCEYQFMRGLLEREGMWSSFLRYFAQLWPILRDMSRRGIPIDEAKRAELKALILKEGERVDREVRELVPAEVLTTKQKNGYKRPPILECEECGWKGRTDHECPGRSDDGGTVVDADHNDVPDILGDCNDIQLPRRVPYLGLAEIAGLVQREVTLEEEEKCLCTKKLRESCLVCHGSGIVPVGYVDLRWASPVEFNPNSSQQVKRFMRYMGHPIPKHQKRVDASGEASDTTEVRELERLAASTKHPIYSLLIQKRQLTKVDGTYCTGWEPWKEDSCVHPTFTYNTSIWQLSARQPNSQNGLKHVDPDKYPLKSEMAKAFNGMQRAKEGHVLINFDWKSFFPITMSHDFNMPRYCRLARLDIHSFVTCYFLHLPERIGLWERSDEEMLEIFKRLKKDQRFKFTRDYKSKRVILGMGNGLFYRKMYQVHREDFENETEAKRLYETVIGIFPELKRGQEAVKKKAAEDRRLVNKFGAIRHFFDVQRFDRKQQKWIGGDQAEAAIAFLPSSHAFGHARANMLVMREKGWDEKYGLVNTIHDSLTFHCRKELQEECLANIKEQMEKPSEVLIYPGMAPEGVWVGVEAQWGESMADLHS